MCSLTWILSQWRMQQDVISPSDRSNVKEAVVEKGHCIIDILLFPLICPEWNANEEMLLLEGIEMYGMGNWAEVADWDQDKRSMH
ncbi:ADA2 2B [Perilla frutescens var. frutescens]|nr:ADA2 2B [Perilla frutescens var. frutescens]